MKYFFILVFLLSSCEPYMDHAWFFTLNNSSSKKVWYYISYNLPDTTLEINRPQQLSMLNVNESHDVDNSKEWGDVINNLPSKKLAIYFIDNDTINKYDWATIRDNYKILKRIEFSAKDLDSLKNIIIYK